MDRRVVITGIGPVTPVGIGLDDFWNSMVSGKSGISLIEGYEESKFKLPVKIGGQVKNFDITKYWDDPKKVRSFNKDMDRVAQFAVVAAKLAIEDSNATIDEFAKYGVDPFRIATFVGTGIGGISTTCDDVITLYERGIKAVGLRSIIRLMPNAAAGHIGILWGYRGRAKADSTACASGLDSIVDAYWHIKTNQADAVIAGGSEACLNPLAISSFYNMTALSRREAETTEASCPFDKRRDGFVMSEGSTMFVLEELELAKKRGAKIYGELVGAGGSCDAYHITAPSEDGSGGALAIETALKTAGLENNREAVDYIHAHGTSTPLNDARETRGIKKVFGDHAYKLCVSSTKSMTGHLIGAAGPVGLAAATMATIHSKIPPTINYKEADPDCDLDYVPNVARDRNVDYAMVQALGFGGHNTVAIVKKFTK
jgi:3-oxoacyl-[acyl-carrier-protein] synthase II